MSDFYSAVREANPNRQNIAMTVIEGEAFGEKALLSNHEIVWQSEGTGFFARNEEAVKAVQDGGVYPIGGQKVF